MRDLGAAKAHDRQRVGRCHVALCRTVREELRVIEPPRVNVERAWSGGQYASSAVSASHQALTGEKTGLGLNGTSWPLTKTYSVSELGKNRSRADGSGTVEFWAWDLLNVVANRWLSGNVALSVHAIQRRTRSPWASIPPAISFNGLTFGTGSRPGLLAPMCQLRLFHQIRHGEGVWTTCTPAAASVCRSPRSISYAHLLGSSERSCCRVGACVAHWGDAW